MKCKKNKKNNKDKMDYKIIYQLRTAIFLAAIAAFGVSLVNKGIAKEIIIEDVQLEDNGETQQSEGDFWPPDLVPHPHMPEPKPSDNRA